MRRKNYLNSSIYLRGLWVSQQNNPSSKLELKGRECGILYVLVSKKIKYFYNSNNN